MYKTRVVLVLTSVAMLIMAAALLAGAPAASGHGGVILPANAKVHGKSLAQWLEGYWRWYYTGGAAETVPEQPGAAPIAYMPLPAGEQTGGSWTPDDPAVLVGSLEVNLKPGTAFVLPCFAWISERYDPDLSNNQPDDPPLSNDRIQSTVTGVDGTGLPALTLDGQPILQNFWDYYVGPLPFDPVAAYPEPSGYGSVAAIAFQGVGFVMAPLKPGTYTLHLLERMTITNADFAEPGYQGTVELGLIYDNTWIITVTK
ncbi:MAG: hypothetical protein QUV05_12240 [Phycisphaerae bacterium]|nr:hypothetical protein [Phycisphaerae bacterium]